MYILVRVPYYQISQTTQQICPRKSYIEALNFIFLWTDFRLNNNWKWFVKNPLGCIVILKILFRKVWSWLVSKDHWSPLSALDMWLVICFFFYCERNEVAVVAVQQLPLHLVAASFQHQTFLLDSPECPSRPIVVCG